MDIRTKRIYESAAAEDGRRVLIDRLWPRGVSKEEAKLDAWVKDVAPSTELREWYGHDPQRYDSFQEKYRQELKNLPAAQAAVKELLAMVQEGRVTLLYAAKDKTENPAVVLKDYLEKAGKGKAGGL